MVLGLLLFSSLIFYSTAHLWIKSWYLLVWSSLLPWWYQEFKRNRVCMVLGLLLFFSLIFYSTYICLPWIKSWFILV
ncbi:hypothetical protein BC941DRAFT_445030, partial [Chlamydoabsidia padenii]